MANRYKVNGSTNTWRDTTGWSLNSGDTGGASYPVAGDTAIFDSHSSNCLVDVDSACSSIDLLDYSNTLNIGNTFTLTVSDGGYVKQIGGLGTLKIAGTTIFNQSSTVYPHYLWLYAAGSFSGHAAFGETATLDCGDTDASDLYIYGQNIVGYNTKQIASWNISAGGVACSAIVLGNTSAGELSDPTSAFSVYKSLNIVGSTNSLAPFIGACTIGAGGCSGLIYFSSGSLVQQGNIGTLKISDASAFTSYSRTSGTVTNLNIVTCSGTKTLDLGGMVISTGITVAGNSKLTLIGLVTYGGLYGGCTITNTTILNSPNSGSPIFALTADGNTDGTGNTGWVFAGMNLYFKAVGGAWTDAAKWSATSKDGTDTARVPTALDTAIFQYQAGACTRTNGNDTCLNLVMGNTTTHQYYTTALLSMTNLAIHGGNSARSVLSCISGELIINSGVWVGFVRSDISATANITCHNGCQLYGVLLTDTGMDHLAGDGTGTITFDEDVDDYFSDVFIWDYNIIQASHLVSIQKWTLGFCGNKTMHCDAYVGNKNYYYGGGAFYIGSGANGSTSYCYGCNQFLPYLTSMDPDIATAVTLGAGGVNNAIHFFAPAVGPAHVDLTILGIVAELDIADIYNQLRSIATSGAGIINSFNISACSAPRTFNLNGIAVVAFNINGTSSDNLKLTGAVAYTGGTSSSTFQHVTVEDSTASGNDVYALGGVGSDIVNGGGNTKWIFSLPRTLIESIGDKDNYDTGTVTSSGLVLTLVGGAWDYIAPGNWGAGDVITVNATDYYVASVNSATQLTLQSWQDAPAISVASAYIIKRAYKNPGGIVTWENSSAVDCVSLQENRIGLCYNDGVDYVNTSTIVFSSTAGYTNASYHRKLSVAVGNRHLGRLTEGVCLSYTALTGNVSIQLQIQEPYFVIEHLRLKSPGYYATKYVGRAIYCPGVGVAQNITINSVIIHDWICQDTAGWSDWETYYEGLVGIFIQNNGGCKIFNSYITNLHKVNNDNDNGAIVGIFINNSIEANYVYNNTVLDLISDANAMKHTCGIETDSSTDEKNNISMVRHYMYDQASIPNASVEDYSHDFEGIASASSDYNCEYSGGYLQTHFVQGANSKHGINPFDVFVSPGHSPDHGNGFMGWAWDPPSFKFGFSAYPDDGSIYRVAPGETGTITFTGVDIFWIAAGYLLGEGGTLGAKTYLKISSPYNIPFDYDTPDRTLNAVFTYTDSSMTKISGDGELEDVLMIENGVIKFDPAYFALSPATDFTTKPITPSGGSYVADSIYTTLIGSDGDGHTGLVAVGLISVGQRHDNSFRYSISGRSVVAKDATLKYGCPCASAGTAINLTNFPELTYDITGASRV